MPSVTTGANAANRELTYIGVSGDGDSLSIGMALVIAPLTTAIMNTAPDVQAGAASGVNNAASRLASLFAIAIIGAVASAVFAGEIGDPTIARFGMLPASDDPERGALEAAFKDAYRVSMWLVAGWGALAAALAAWFLPGKKAV